MSTRIKFLTALTILVAIINIGIVFIIFNQPKDAVAAISGYKLTPILMIPSDKTAKPEYQNSINQAMADIQSWYAKQIGSTFKYDLVTTVTSSHPDSYFRCSTGSCAIAGGVGTDYNLVNNDLDTLVGARTAQVDRVIFLIGSGPLIIGGGSLDSSRFAILGDSNLDGISGLTSAGAINQQRGAVAHEIGHTFDLPHPQSDLPEYDNLMGVGWYNFPNVLINDTKAVPESNYIKKSPFLLKQSIPGCTQFTGTHLSITQNTVLCPGVFRINGSTGGVISIDADNVTLDASNSSFLGNDTTSGKYGLIITGRANVTVKNIRFSGYFYGIKVESSSNITIQDSVANYNRQTDNTFLNINIAFPGEGGGVVFNNVTNSTVKNNMLNNQNTGVHLFNSSNNTIENNHAGFSKTWGVALYGSDNNSILHNDTQHVNRCTDGGCDSAGILLVQGSDNNLIEGNNMNYSGDGFFLGNGTAPVTTSNNNLVRNNVANFSPNNGYEATFSSGNVFDSNEANGNNYGFWLGYSHDGQVVDNFIKDNRTNGIDIDRGRGWTISGNTFKNNVNGLYLHNNGVYDSNWAGTEVSNNYSITHNSFVANSFGLNIQNTQTSTVQNNTFTANGRNVSYGDTSLATSGLTTSNNNFICSGGGSGNGTNLVLNKTTTSNIAGSYPERANDGDTTGGLGIPYASSYTWYVGGVTPGLWWQADMASVQTFDSVVAYAYANNYVDMPHQFHFEVSTTGSFSGEQTTVATETGWNTRSPANPRYAIYTFAAVTGRYLRMVLDNNDGQNWTQVQEIEVYSDPNLASTYSPNSVCSYNFYDNLPSTTTTNVQANYWEYSPIGSLAATIYDYSVNSSVGVADYSSPLGSRATTTSDNLSPSLVFNSPSSGATLFGSLSIGVTATDNVRVRSVDYYVDDIYLGSNFLSPFSLTFNTLRIADGAHTLKAVTTDNADNSVTTTIPVTFSNNFVLDTTSPSVPSGLTPTSTSPTQIVFTWTASTDNTGVTDYYVKRDGSLVVQQSATIFTDNNVTSGTSYSYTLAAADAADNISADSASLAVTASTSADTQAPTVPTNLVAIAVSTTEIDLSWTPSSDNIAVDSYEVFRNGESVGTTAANLFTDTGLTPGTSYTYAVIAKDAAGNPSAASSSVSATTDSVVTPPQPPQTGPKKIGDLNSDNRVDIYDLSILLSQWSKTGVGDINSDGKIDIYDLSILLSKWGT